MPDATDLTTPARKLTQLAGQRPEQVAVTFVALDGRRGQLTWADLEAQANRLARRLAEAGVGSGDFVAIGLGNSVEHVIAAQATWKLGGCAMPVGSTLPPAERDALIALAEPKAEVSDWPDRPGITSAEIAGLAQRYSDAPLEDAVPQPFKAIGSGGSTGKPKLIVSPGAFAYPGGTHPLAGITGLGDGHVAFSPGPLYHNQAFLLTSVALYSGASVVLTERFRPELTLALVAELGVTYLNVVPTMMARMLRSPAIETADLSSIEVLMHMAAPCPEWVKRGWIDRIGAEHVWELWAATELTGITVIRGDEWLQRPGSVGKPIATEIQIIGPDGTQQPPGEVGEIYSRFGGVPTAGYAYLGAPALPERPGGFRSVGDLGYLDDDGYLYLADRRTDLIISGGANVYPAEVESVLSTHDGVADVAVIGLPDEDLGQRVHAVVRPAQAGSDALRDELLSLCAQQLARYKCPRDIEFVAELPRAETGKLRRSALRDERVSR